MYSFKVYYVDGSSEVLNGFSPDPKGLYNILDGFLSLDEIYELDEKELTNKQVLEIGIRACKSHLKEFNRLEIINIDTLEVIDGIDC